MQLSKKPKKVAKKELAPLIIEKCYEESTFYNDAISSLYNKLGHIPEEDDLTEELITSWRAEYVNRVAAATVEELSNAFPGFGDDFRKVSDDPFEHGFDFFEDAFENGMAAAMLYMLCFYVLTGKVINYGTGRPLSAKQTEIMNAAIIEAFEDLPEEPTKESSNDLNEEASLYRKLLEERFANDRIELTDNEIDLYANMFAIISKFVHGKLNFEEMYLTYDFLGDVVTERVPAFAASVPSEERISVQFRAMECMNDTADKLTLDEKLHLAYCVYHSLFVQVYDEENDKISSGLVDFDSAERIEMCFQDDCEMHPERYAFITEETKEVPADATFGFEKQNPIGVVSVSDAYAYLNCLKKPGYILRYDRICSCSGPHGLMDQYAIYAVPENNPNVEPIKYNIYIDPYAQQNTLRAPEGFVLELPDM